MFQHPGKYSFTLLDLAAKVRSLHYVNRERQKMIDLSMETGSWVEQLVINMAT